MGVEVGCVVASTVVVELGLAIFLDEYDKFELDEKDDDFSSRSHLVTSVLVSYCLLSLALRFLRSKWVSLSGLG